jgi:hypothetical protein
LTVVSKQRLTPEAIAERLKKVTDNMMENLTKAYEQLPPMTDSMAAEDKDPEIEMLRLMATAKRLRDKVHGLKVRKKGKG